jgi:hypothetical protein
MSATAGYAHGTYITTSSSTPSSSDLLNGCDNTSWKRMYDSIDVTAIEHGGEHSEIGGIKRSEFEVSGNYLPSDTAQGRLETAVGDRSSVYVHFYPLGHATAGKKVQCLCTSFDIDASNPQAVKFKASLKSIGAPDVASTF